MAYTAAVIYFVGDDVTAQLATLMLKVASKSDPAKVKNAVLTITGVVP